MHTWLTINSLSWTVHNVNSETEWTGYVKVMHRLQVVCRAHFALVPQTGVHVLKQHPV